MGRLWNPPPRKVVLFRALKLGDMLCAVPALRALREEFPGAEITLVGLPWAEEFAGRFRRYVDRFRVFPGYPGLPEQEPAAERLPAFFAALRAERFDLAIQFHGSGTVSNEVVAQFGARINVGFYDPAGARPDPRTFFPYPGRGLEVRRLLALVERLGIAPRGEELEFPIAPEEQRQAHRLLEECGLEPGGFACLHGGASVPERRWPVERFAEVGDRLAGLGLDVVLTGTAGEAELARAIAREMQAPAIDLAGRTPLGVLAALLAGAGLLVCNDTGVSHLADALNVPSVVISTGDNPDRWAPADRRRHRVLCRDPVVPVGEVLVEIDDLWNSPARRAAAGTRGLNRGEEPCARCAS